MGKKILDEMARESGLQEHEVTELGELLDVWQVAAPPAQVEAGVRKISRRSFRDTLVRICLRWLVRVVLVTLVIYLLLQYVTPRW